MSIFSTIEQGVIDFANFIWGMPLLITILCGGFVLLVYSKGITLRLIGDIPSIMRGKVDGQEKDGGLIGRFQALATSLGTTVGLGNIAGIAVAIKVGGPGTLFWMWVAAFVGMCIEFFTSTLAVMYRSHINGRVEAGPMYIIVNGLGKQWKALAVLFCVAGAIGALPIFQSNQLAQAIQYILLEPQGVENNFISNLLIGVGITILVSSVIFGGIEKLAAVSGKVVPFMILLYWVLVLCIVFTHLHNVPTNFLLIVQDAFSAQYYTGEHIFGSALGGLIVLGARRSTFACEAGIGTCSMVHGVTKTNNPVQQGILSMMGPFTTTMVVCSLTGFAILSTNYWREAEGATGISLALLSFEDSFAGMGGYLLFVCILFFAVTSLFSYSYLGANSFGFLLGTKNKFVYNYIYVGSIIIGSVSSLGFILSVIDSAYAIMAFPTMFVTIALAHRVFPLIKEYIKRKKAA